MDLFMASNLPFFAQIARETWQDGQIENLRTALLSVPYLLGAVGIAIAAFNAKGAPEELLKAVFLGLLITVLVVGYREALEQITEAFWEMRESVKVKNEMNGIFDADFADKPSIALIGDYIAYILAEIFKNIGLFGTYAIAWLQGFALAGLYVISPIGIGMIALPWTRQIGINFIMTSIGVALWALGIAVVDIVLALLSTQILAVAGLGGTAGAIAGTIPLITGGWAAMAGAMALLCIIVNAMYLSVPFIVAAIMRGGNPFTAAAGGGLKGVAMAAGLALGAKQLAGGGGSGGGSGDAADARQERQQRQQNSKPVEPADSPNIQSAPSDGGRRSSQSYSSGSGGGTPSGTSGGGGSPGSGSGGDSSGSGGGGSPSGTSGGGGSPGSGSGGQAPASAPSRPIKSAKEIAAEQSALRIKQTIDEIRSIRR